MTGTGALRTCSPMTIHANANDGWRLSCQAVQGTRGWCASSEHNSSQFELIWMSDRREAICTLLKEKL